MRIEDSLGGSSLPALKPFLSKQARAAFRDRVTRAASTILKAESSEAWAPSGRLGNRHLTVSFERKIPGGVARFNVLDADGYRGAPKCNLFALEVAHRAGFSVPIVPRRRGFGFPGADAMARAAGRGDIRGWAERLDSAGPGELNARRELGACLLLVASTPGKSPGHVVVVDRVLGLDRHPTGEIESVCYAGWDASRGGARFGRGVMRVIRRGGRFDEIHVLSLVRAPGSEAVLVGSRRAGCSRRDGRPA